MGRWAATRGPPERDMGSTTSSCHHQASGPSRAMMAIGDLVAAAEAALGKPEAKAKAKASVQDVVTQAEAKFGKRATSKDVIRRVPVKKDEAKQRGRPKGSRNKKTLEREAAAAALVAA